MELLNLKALNFKKFDLSKILNLSKNVDEVIVVDLNSELVLCDLSLRGDLKVKAFKRVDLSADTNKKAISKAISDFIIENNISHNNAILNPSLQSTLIKRIQLPAVPDSELLEAIKWEIKEDVSFDLPDAVLDFSVIKKTTKEDSSRVLTIMCAVAKEEEVRKQVLLLKEAGLNCLAVSLLAFSYGKFIPKYLDVASDKASGIFHLGENSCYLAIYKDKKIEFYRELSVSLNKLRNSLSGVLASDKGQIKLSSEEINEMLFKVGMPQADTVIKGKLTSTQVMAMIRPMLEHLVLDIKRSLSYYYSQLDGDKVEGIFIAGLALRIPNVEVFLSQELNLDVRKISAIDKIKFSSGLDQEAFSTSVSLLGLAIDYRDDINLLPYEFRTEKIEHLEKISLRWIAIIVFITLMVSYLFVKGESVIYRRRLKNASVHINVLSDVKQTVTKVKELNQFIISTKSSQAAADKILMALSFVSRREMFLNDFSLNSGSKQGSMSGVVKSKRNDSYVLLTNFVNKLESIGYFASIDIASVAKRKEESFDIVEFKIAFKTF